MKPVLYIVDDIPDNRTMLKMMFQMKGYEIVEAQDGVDALEKLAVQKADCMILDVMMPNMDGITLCKKLREKSDTANLPIIMLSGKTQPEDIQAGLDAGANYYMKKPQNTVKLFTLVQEYSQKGQKILQPA
ncbi:MAG: response regulator [Chloroflexota bacterium]